jgi:hypothetical protein
MLLRLACSRGRRRLLQRGEAAAQRLEAAVKFLAAVRVAVVALQRAGTPSGALRSRNVAHKAVALGAVRRIAGRWRLRPECVHAARVAGVR